MIGIRKSGDKGFTMMEMMIIVVIIGIVSAMAVPTLFRAMPRLKSRTEARNVLNLVRLARSRAISDGSQYGVIVNTVNRQYQLFKDTVNPGQMNYQTGDSVITGPIALDPGVNLSSSTFTNNCVVFLPTGGASQSGSFVFHTTDGEARYEVSVLGSTGRSKLQ